MDAMEDLAGALADQTRHPPTLGRQALAHLDKVLQAATQ